MQTGNCRGENDKNIWDIIERIAFKIYMWQEKAFFNFFHIKRYNKKKLHMFQEFILIRFDIFIITIVKIMNISST